MDTHTEDELLKRGGHEFTVKDLVTTLQQEWNIENEIFLNEFIERFSELLELEDSREMKVALVWSQYSILTDERRICSMLWIKTKIMRLMFMRFGLEV